MVRDHYRPGEIFLAACREVAEKAMCGHKVGPGPAYFSDNLIGGFYDNYAGGEIPEGIEQMAKDDYFDFEPYA